MLIDSLNLLTFRPNGGVLNVYLKVQDIKSIEADDHNVIIHTVDGDTHFHENDSIADLFCQPNDFVLSVIAGEESKITVTVDMLMSDVVKSGSEETFRLGLANQAALINNDVRFGQLEGYDVIEASGIKLRFDCHFNFERLIEAPPRLHRLPIFK